NLSALRGSTLRRTERSRSGDMAEAMAVDSDIAAEGPRRRCDEEFVSERRRTGPSSIHVSAVLSGGRDVSSVGGSRRAIPPPRARTSARRR
ncbi:MAG: hypothetical protein ACKOYL_06095, partial [Actinomycetota bacterium]